MPGTGPHPADDSGDDTPAAVPAAGIPVVGVGASAGGLEAFTRLLSHLPTDSGFAFVLVQHLDATHPSSLSEILGRATPMPVAEATDGLAVTPDHVYVIPPNTELTLAGGRLRLGPRQAPSASHLPIDQFFRSLARDCGSRAIGVVLSGAGADGSAGLVAIKEGGGITFAQAPPTAEFPSMPERAIASGVVDTVLAPEGIAEALVRIARHPIFGPWGGPGPAMGAALTRESDEYRAICRVMHQATGVDFSLYRERTVARRIQRRLALRSVGTVGEYVDLLTADGDERATLLRDLLIGVTSFFREPASFDTLNRLVFPAIVRDHGTDGRVRIWVPGCASGEEAYSILIALDEYQREHGTSYPVQLFASDISDVAVARARQGRYPGSIAADVSPERLRRYFVPAGDGYQIAKDLRERCVVSRHNLLDDPPFSRLDLISCRNVLIYLEAVQKRIIPIFHYALRDPGFLILGRSETAHFPELFSPVDPLHRVYTRVPSVRKPYGFLPRPAIRDGVAVPESADRHAGRGVPSDVGRDADRLLLSRFSPTGVIVDQGLEVLEIRGRPAPFLALPTGKLSFHLLKLIPDTGLFLEIERLVQAAFRTGGTERRDGVAYDSDGQRGVLAIEVAPLGGPQPRACLILFEHGPAARVVARALETPPVAADGPVGDRERTIARLQEQLAGVRERLVSIMAEHETFDEESQRATADALSSNEELQSLTEELETAKEELQSTNEELLTVNRDLETRNVSLTSARDLAQSVVETVAVPLVVLDGALRVRNINGSFTSTFHLSRADVQGRPLLAVFDGAWDDPELRDRLTSVLPEREPFTGFEMQLTLPGIGERTVVVSGRPIERLEMILLTVDDVTALRAAEQALQASEGYRRQAERMETVGRLAGGIAHDFNNLLTVILGYCGLLDDTLGDGAVARGQVREIQKAAERAAALTDQLLVFSRRKLLQPEVFDVDAVVGDFERMLRRLLSETVRVVVRRGPRPCWVKADPGEFGRVLMNLCLNARDAMPAGGTLTIECGSTHVDAEQAGTLGVPAGPYVRLAVRDSGVGMDAATRAHLFEPFFTTKDPSKGVGLGLSTVLGIVVQSAGAITCDSEPGRGTTFAVFLPAQSAAPDGTVLPPVGLAQAPRGRSEVVLVVEDEAGVRGLTRTVLERTGYTVLEAGDGREALALIGEHEGPLDLIVTDVVMPELGGRELADRVRALRPGVSVLFVSGYTEDVLLKEGVARGAAFLQKPFTPVDLARKVRAILDGRDGPPGPS